MNRRDALSIGTIVQYERHHPIRVDYIDAVGADIDLTSWSVQLVVRQPDGTIITLAGSITGTDAVVEWSEAAMTTVVGTYTAYMWVQSPTADLRFASGEIIWSVKPANAEPFV